MDLTADRHEARGRSQPENLSLRIRLDTRLLDILLRDDHGLEEQTYSLSVSISDSQSGYASFS